MMRARQTIPAGYVNKVDSYSVVREVSFVFRGSPATTPARYSSRMSSAPLTHRFRILLESEADAAGENVRSIVHGK